MSLGEIADRVIETDVLIIGGGVAGLACAIKARENNLDVALFEKANTIRSGSAGIGIDHHGGPFPRDGMSVVKIVENEARRFAGACLQQPDLNVRYRVASNMFWSFKEMEKLGVPMSWDDGEPYWTPQGPTTDMNRLRVNWRYIKPILSKQAKKKGTDLLQRTVAVDLLTNKGSVVGATAVNIRTGEFIVAKAKATVISTGMMHRQFDPLTPSPWKYKFRYHFCPASISGDGYALAYRAGAELVNMDVTGQGYRIRDDLTLPYGHFPLNDGIPAKCFTWKGDEIITPNNAKRYQELDNKGLTPLYLSLEHLPEDYQKRCDVCTAEERLVSFKIAEERGFDPHSHRYEMGALKPVGHNRITGVVVNEEFKTRLKGLYAIGDTIAGGGGSSGASCVGLLLGNDLRKFTEDTDDHVIDDGQIKEQKEKALRPLFVKNGTEPLEFESAVRYAMERYAGELKSEGKVLEGLRRLDTLRRKGLPLLMAKNLHYLLGCLEARNILEMSILDMQAILERKETRGVFVRQDYPEKDPKMEGKLIFQRLEDGKPVVELRECVDLKPEYRVEGKQYGGKNRV